MKRRLALMLTLALTSPHAAATAGDPPKTPLHDAVKVGDVDAVRELVGDRKQLFARDGFGQSALIVAAALGRNKIARFLLQAGIDVDARDMAGNTALHYAVQAGLKPTVMLLLERGAAPAVYNKRCETPLAYAAGFGRQDLYRLLEPKLARAAPPKDGTKEECKLDKTPPLGYDAERVAFHERHLVIDDIEDYGAALVTLSYLQTEPKLARQLLPRITNLVDHASPEGAEEFAESDLIVRQVAVQTLQVVATTSEAKARVSARLAATLSTGGCDAFLGARCQESVQRSCDVSEIFHGLHALARQALHRPALQARWPRDEGDEICYNCRNCRSTRVGNAYTAASAWFKMYPRKARP